MNNLGLPVNIGYGNIVMANRIITIVSPESSPVKRIIQEYKEHGRVIDATCGRRTRAVLVMDNGTAVLSSLLPETIGNRIKDPLKSKNGEENDCL